MRIRVLLADDQALLRSGVRMMLDAEPDIDVVGEAEDGAEALDLCARHRVDVVLMDVQMPRMNGVDATRELYSGRFDPAPRVIVLTTFDLDEYVYASLKAGASGYLLKNATPDELAGAIRVVAAGDSLLAPTVTHRLIQEFARRPAPPAGGPVEMADLTAREVEVFALVVAGRTNAEIASELVLSELTVKTHVSRILAKVGARDRIQAVILAYETGFLRPGS